MFKALCCVALLVPSAALVVQNISNIQPKSAKPEGVELLWHRPKGEVKGIMLYLHGCHGRATGLFTSNGTDGFHFNVCDTTKKGKCMGNIDEVLFRQKARKRGYLVAAVSGGVGSPRGCMNTNDVPRIQLAMKHLIEKEEPDLKDKPVIMLGHSSGGRVLPELVTTGASIKNAQCIVPVADEIRIKGDSSAPLGPTQGYPEDVSVFFVHMDRDKVREENVQKNIGQMKAKGVRTGDLKVGHGPVTPELFEAEGYGMSKENAKLVHQALKSFVVPGWGPLLKGQQDILNKNPYGSGDNWQTAMDKPKYRKLLEEIGGYATLQQYMDVAWSEHWMAAGRKLDEIIAFCEKPGSKRIHQVNQDKSFDLVAQVRDINFKAQNWKSKFDKEGHKLNWGGQMKLKATGKKEEAPQKKK